MIQNETIETLRKAKEVLYERGWTTGTYEADDGSVCLVGACRAALGIPNTAYAIAGISRAALAATESALSVHLGRYVGGWNDNEAEHIDDVLDAIDATIKELEQP